MGHLVTDLVQFLFYSSAPHRDLHSFPTRRSSDLRGSSCGAGRRRRRGRAGHEQPEERPRPYASEEDHVQLEQPRQRPGHRSEEHTSELQSLAYLVCRLLLEKKKKKKKTELQCNPK